MLYPIIGKYSLRAIIAAAVGPVAMMMVGCSEQPGWSETTGNTPVAVSSTAVAVVASDKTPAAAPAAPADVTVTMAFPTGNRATSDLLVEETTPREARVGQSITYQMRVTNLRSTPLRGIVLEQRVPASLQVSSETPENHGNEAANSDHRARIEVGDLDPNQTRTVQMAGTVTKQGMIDTCLSARYNPPTLCTMVNVVAPALSIMAQGPSEVDICGDLSYVYSITNTGTGTAHNVVLEEKLPEGLRTGDGQAAFSANIGDIGAGQSKSATVHLKADWAGKFTTKAFAHSDDAGRAASEEIATSVLAPRLAVTVAGPKEDYLGDQLVYSVTVKNEGDAPAAHTKVRLGATPGSVTFVSAQNADGSKLSEEQPGTGQDLGMLAPGESRTVSITFIAQREGDLTLDATAGAKCAQPVTTPVNTRIRTITASALEVTHDPDPVRVGNDVKYHITVQNKGSAPDHNVKVTVMLPESMQFINGSGATAANAEGQNITFAAVPELAPKQSVSWNVEAKALQPAETKVQVKMTSDATKTAALKVEPTRLFSDVQENQQRTNIAPPAGANAPTPPAGNAPNK